MCESINPPEIESQGFEVLRRHLLASVNGYSNAKGFRLRAKRARSWEPRSRLGVSWKFLVKAYHQL